jgi:hypothetical protein
MSSFITVIGKERKKEKKKKESVVGRTVMA